MIFVDTRQNKSLRILIKIILVVFFKKIENKSEDYLEFWRFCWKGYGHNEKHRKMYISYKVFYVQIFI